jgi:hypothetical protein
MAQWYEQVDTWIAILGSGVAGAVGWGLKTWRSVSSTQADRKEDEARGSWYSDMTLRIKEEIARADASEASSRLLLKDKTQDAAMIARQEVTIEYLKEKALRCETTSIKSEKRLHEMEERNRALSEQILLAHYRLRKMFVVLSSMDAIIAAKFVKEQNDENIHDVIAHIKEQDSMREINMINREGDDVKPNEGK